MEKDNIFKDIWRLFHSMKFGIILLLIIGVSSIAGTLIPQDNIIGFYESTYSPGFFKLIEIFSLHKVYSSWWFIIMVAMLSLNLTLCSIKRLPLIIKQIKRKANIDHELKRENFLFKKETKADLDVEEIFTKAGFKNVEKTERDEGIFYFAEKGKIGYIGSWITHVGLLIIILAYVFGKITGFDVYVHGVPGSIQEVEGTDYLIEIEDFDIEFRDDHTVNQYISQIEVRDKEGKYSQKGDVRVNHPFRAEKMNIYQNGTGWAVDVEMKKNDEKISSKTLYQSEVYAEDENNIALQFANFYPDYDNSHGHPMTISPYPNNPKLLYSVFYEGVRVDMNVVGMGEEIVWEEYTINVDNPQMFTLLQVGQDLGMKVAGFGGLILIIGIILAFYIHPKELLAFKDKNGKIRIWGKASKNQEIYKEEMDIILNKAIKEEI